MVTIKLAIPVEIAIIRDKGFQNTECELLQSLIVKELCLPRSMEVFVNPKSGVLLIHEIDEPDGR